MTTSPLLLVVLLAALASTAAAADAGTTLRGKTVRNHHQHHKIKPADVAATEAVMAQAAPATKPGTESTINLKHTMTTGENLGQNSPFAGIEYLGTGYDILKGNPDGDRDTKIDPGFRRPVVYLTWGQNDEDLTRDMVYLQPKEGWAMSETSCNMASSSIQSSTMDEYTSDLSVEASVSAGYDDGIQAGSFSASAGYGDFKSNVVTKEGSQYTLRSFCVKFKAGLSRGPTSVTGIHPVKSFEDRAKALPVLETLPVEAAGGEAETTETKHLSAAGVQLWMDFFADYGTHIIDSVHLGGKMTFTMSMEKSAQDEMQTNKVDVAAEFEGSYGPYEGAAAAKVAVESESNKAFSKAKKTMKTIVLGGNPPDDPRTGFGAWAESVAAAPMPVKYTLRPLTEAGSPALAEPARRTTFDHMLEKYVDTTVAHAKSTNNAKMSANAGPPTLFPNGDAWDLESVKDKHGNSLKLLKWGTMYIQNGLGNTLWHSLASNWVYDKNSGVTRNSMAAGEQRLEYNKDGNLYIYDGAGVKVWSSMTATENCNGEGPGKVVFDKGVLKITGNQGNVLWSSGTKGNGNVPKAADVKYWGPGHLKDVCKKKNGCVTLFSLAKGTGEKKEYAPGIHEGLGTKGYYKHSSYKINEGQCYAFFYSAKKVSASGVVTTHANSNCEKKYYFKSDSCDSSMSTPNVIHFWRMHPFCPATAKVGWTKYIETLAVVPAWEVQLFNRFEKKYTGTNTKTYNGCNEDTNTKVQEKSYADMTYLLKTRGKGCHIGYKTGGVAVC